MKIKILGTPGEGKSGVASFIEHALKLHGIQARVIDEPGEQYFMAADMARKMHAVAEQGTEITIEVVTLQKSAIINR